MSELSRRRVLERRGTVVVREADLDGGSRDFLLEEILLVEEEDHGTF